MTSMAFGVSFFMRLSTKAMPLTTMNRHKMMTPHDMTEDRFDTMKKKRSGLNRPPFASTMSSKQPTATAIGAMM